MNSKSSCDIQAATRPNDNLIEEARRSNSSTDDFQDAATTLYAEETKGQVQTQGFTAMKTEKLESQKPEVHKTKSSSDQITDDTPITNDLPLIKTHFEQPESQGMLGRLIVRVTGGDGQKQHDRAAEGPQSLIEESPNKMQKSLSEIEDLRTCLAIATSAQAEAEADAKKAWDQCAIIQNEKVKLETKNRNALSQISQERGALEACNQTLFKTQTSLKEANSSLKQQDRMLIQASEDRERLTKDNEKKSVIINEIKQQLDQAEKHIGDLKNDIDYLSAIIEGLREAPSQRLDDEYFKEAYSNLKSKVEMWAEDHFKGKLRQSVDSHSDMELRGSIDEHEYEQYLCSNSHRYKMVQFYTWSLLMERVFTGSQEHAAALWAAPHQRHFTDFLGALRPADPRSDGTSSQATRSVRDFHRFRSNATWFFHASYAEDQARSACTKVVDSIGDHIWSLVSMDGGAKPEEFRGKLEEIVDLAMKMDLDMKLQFPHYYLALPLQGRTRFDEAEMKVDYEIEMRSKEGEGMRRGEIVGLVESPVLFKLGKWDGLDFDRPKKVIKRATVMPPNALVRQNFQLARSGTGKGKSWLWNKVKGGSK